MACPCRLDSLSLQRKVDWEEPKKSIESLRIDSFLLYLILTLTLTFTFASLSDHCVFSFIQPYEPQTIICNSIFAVVCNATCVVLYPLHTPRSPLLHVCSRNLVLLRSGRARISGGPRRRGSSRRRRSGLPRPRRPVLRAVRRRRCRRCRRSVRRRLPWAPRPPLALRGRRRRWLCNLRRALRWAAAPRRRGAR